MLFFKFYDVEDSVVGSKSKFLLSFFALAMAISGFASAEEKKTGTAEQTLAKAETLPEESVSTTHSVEIGGQTIPYTATTGTINLKEEATGKIKASIFYTAYTRNDVTDKTKRPIIYLFNGGPGSSSVWLHMGLFGPKRVAFDNGYAVPPYQFVNNDFSMLDAADLVFIDPVSTGYSRPGQGEDAKQFHGVEEDIKSVAEFIRLYTTRNDRWQSPKYLAGESYGTTRAAGLAGYLQDNHYMYINGVILVSSILNFQTISDSHGGNDLPYISYLPSFAATAFYHKKLSPELQKDLQTTLREVENFAITEYAQALMQGDTIDLPFRQKVIEKLSRYTGLSKEYIDRANMRVSGPHFAKELLRDQKRTLGRFDSRYKGSDSNACGSTPESDPSFDAVAGAFTGAFNHYISDELKSKRDQEYKILTSVQPWNYSPANNQYLNVADTLREVMTKNPTLQVFVASGYYDLATPYFGTVYTFNHLGLEPELRPHVTMKYYGAGHMMFIDYPSLTQMKVDLVNFLKQK